MLLEEARDSYDPDIVHELPSNTMDDLESNIQRIASWIKQWEDKNEAATVER